jgi:hypothetical protein
MSPTPRLPRTRPTLAPRAVRGHCAPRRRVIAVREHLPVLPVKQPASGILPLVAFAQLGTAATEDFAAAGRAVFASAMSRGPIALAAAQGRFTLAFWESLSGFGRAPQRCST